MKHLKLFFALFAMLALGVGNAWGADFTLTSANSVTVDGVTVTFAKGSGSTAPTWYAAGLRLYAKNTVTITSESEITSIVFDWEKQGSKTFASVSANTGSYSHPSAAGKGTWTGSSKSVIFTLASTSGVQLQLNTLSVTTAGSTTPKQKYTLTYQAGSVTGSLEVEEGANLLDALEDITPVACDPTSTEPIGWSESEITTKQANAPTLLTDADVMPSEEHSVYYVFAKKETTGGGTPTETTKEYTFSNYSAGTQYADNEEHKLDDDVTIYTTDCHFTTQLRIYSSSTYNGSVVSNQLPGAIKSMSFNVGYKSDNLLVYGSTDGSTWTEVGSVSTTTSYADKSIDFGETNYTYFKLDVEGDQQVRITKMSVTYMSGGGTTTISDYTTSCSNAPAATLVSIAHTGDKTTFTEGDAFVKSTITATYDDATTKDVTSLATFTGYDMNTTGTQTVTVTYEGKSTTYDITVSAKPTYTITWNNAGTTTEATVVQGAELGELPTVADCPNGKKFMGWTAATSVNSDGTGITYIKSTDKPTANTTYYAVFAVVEGGDGTPTTATQSIETYAEANSWTNESKHTEIPVDANITVTVTGGSNTGKYYTSGTNWRLYQTENATLTISAVAGYEIQTVKVTYTVDKTGVLTLEGSNVVSGTVCDVNAASVTFGVGNTGSATNGQVRITAIEVTYAPAAKRTDYSPNCDISVEPTWTISKNEIAFADKYVGFEYTETFTINASNLAEDIALAIDGSTFTVSPTSIAKDATFPQTVTVTYAPTAVGTHNATLNITSGSTLSKTIALTGSAEEAIIYTLTALADINPTDKVIIVGTSGGSTYAMSNDRGTTGAPTAVAVTVADNKIATNATNILWNIDKNGDNITIYPVNQTAKWLYCTNTNNGVRVGTGEAKEFTMNSGYLYTEGTTDPRYVGIYNTADWRCYTTITGTSNIASQSFAFYVLPDTDPSISVNTTSKDFGAVINGKSASQEFEITARNIATPTFSTSVTGANATYFTATINANKVIVTYAPTAVGEHVATLTITETTTSKSVEVALTGECVETVNVATAMALPVDETAYLSQFEVVYPLKDKSFIYIKDNSGYGLIYDGTLDEQFKAGDRVEGFVGTSSPYKSLPELKAVNKYEDLTITPGVAAEPIEFVTAPTVTDVNKYVVFKNVQFDAAVTFATDAATNTTFTIGSETVTLRNNYKYAASLDANKAYDVYGFVATFQQNEGDQVQVQVYFLTAVEAGGVIETYTVAYDANGATGAAPVDETKYQAGQTFYIENQGELVKEGYEFVGWKYNGTVYEAGKQFTMPTENVTFVAQWEEIVVTPTEDFSAGLWVLVTDASELAAKDYIIVAAAEENFAMKSYESGNNCKQVAITKFGNNNCFLTWTEEIGVFQLLASGSNYTIQDVNTKDYLYAAGSGSNNYLKANDEVPTDADAAKPYIWTISYTDGVATVKATSENRNTLMYNTSSDLFACYASGQKAIAIYKYTTDFYTRDVNVNNYGTISLPYASSKFAGAEFYEVSSLEVGKGLWLDELAAGTALAAGKPYIFKATADKIVVAYEGAKQESPVAGVGGLTGTFTDIAANTVLVGHYIIADNKIWIANDQNTLPANRAYIANTVPTTEQPQLPGRRRVCMGENATTGFDQIVAPEGKAIKVIENGQLIIIRDGVKYNVQGVRL